ncbi:MAG TPA: MarC family protein [Candidatus Methylomirabilis sp.]|nr:MarC family protein [Candidatus Methylomirabilis sp.]
MRDALTAFVALLVAVDILGVLPVYLSLTADLSFEERGKLPRESTLTATAIGVGFLLVGQAIFPVLGVSVGDFQVAGGILLVVISLHDLLNPGKILRRPAASVGVVPIGTPMIVGPAVLTTLLILVQSHGYLITALAFGVNMAIAFLVLRYAANVARLLGEGGSRAVGKVASVFLAAFGVSLVRRGLPGFLDR